MVKDHNEVDCVSLFSPGWERSLTVCYFLITTQLDVTEK